MSNGFAKCVADVLRADIVSSSASAYMATYPTLFNVASAVPYHFYTCLKDIMTIGTSWVSQPWSNMVVDTSGAVLTGTRSIDVGIVRILDQEDSPKDDGPKSSAIGAKYCELTIYLKLPEKNTTDLDRLHEASLRIERLLDYNYAVNICGKTNYIPASDPSIDANSDRRVYWEGSTTNKAVISERDLAILMYGFYTLLFLK